MIFTSNTGSSLALANKVPISFLDVPVHKLTEKGLHSIQLPILLPHELVPWLERHGLFPKLDRLALQQWWEHASKYDLPHAVMSPDSQHHPLWCWGDDAVYNELGEKLICISLGHILDPRKFSMQTCWPIFVLREEACLNSTLIKSSKHVSLKLGSCIFIKTIICKIEDLSAGFSTLFPVLQCAPRLFKKMPWSVLKDHALMPS